MNPRWKEDYAPNLGLDEDEFDYDEFVEREFGTGNTPKKSSHTGCIGFGGWSVWA